MNKIIVKRERQREGVDKTQLVIEGVVTTMVATTAVISALPVFGIVTGVVVGGAVAVGLNSLYLYLGKKGEEVKNK